MKNLTYAIFLSIICTISVLGANTERNEARLVGIWAYLELVTDSAYLNYKQNNLRIMLEYPRGTAADSVEYRYKLDGYDDEWNLLTEGPWVYYNDLSPGKYTFVAQCRRLDGPWGNPLEHSFVITNPWWRTWPALFVYAMLFAGTVAYIVYLIRARIKISNQMMLERNNQRFRNDLVLHATREFRTPLVVIQSIIEKLNDESGYLSRADVRRLRISSRGLIQMVEELADYGRVSTLAEDDAFEVDSDSTDIPINRNIAVLIASPHASLNAVMQRQMQTYFMVYTAKGAEIYDEISANKPDAIVLDTDLTEVNAYDVLRRLKTDAATAHIPVILISSLDNTRSVLRVIRSEADDFLQKPFSSEVLAALVLKKIKSSKGNLTPDVEIAKKDTVSVSQPIYERVSDKEFLQRLNNIVEEQLGDNTFDVGAMAKAMAMSRIGLCGKVKDLCGQTPVEYLREARISRAAELLKSTDKSINEIREMVGMIDPTYFHRRFKEKYGVSPRDYRKTSDK